MSMHVVGFRPPNDKWKKMKAIWDACNAAEIPVPEEVTDFFNETFPDENGVKIDLEAEGCVSRYSDDSRDGFDVDVQKLPPDVTIVRFFNAY